MSWLRSLWDTVGHTLATELVKRRIARDGFTASGDWRASFIYTNYKGDRAWRTIRPIGVFFGRTAYHKDAQWLLVAWDFDRNAERIFAMSDIRDWRVE